MPIDFIPFAAFVPDGGDHGPGLAIVRNALPIHGSWRPTRTLENVSSRAGGPVTGAYVHVYQQAAAVQYLRPNGDLSTTGYESTGASMWATLDEVTPDDADYVFAPNAPAAAILLVSLTDPGATSASNHILRWRYRIPVAPSSTWTVKLELMLGASVIATDTATGTGAVASWAQRSYSLSGGEIAAITGYTDLRFRFTCTAPGSAQAGRPTSDVAINGWKTQAGGSSNLYATIDESSVDDADYVESPTLSLAGAAVTYTIGLGSTITDPETKSGWQWLYRHAGRNDGVKITARLLQGATVIKTVTHNPSGAGSFATATHNLSTAEVALITDLSTLRMEWEASYPTAATSTRHQYARPDNDVSNTFWTPTTGGTLYPMLDEASADDGDFIFVAEEAICVLGLSGVEAAGTTDAHTWVIRARRATGNMVMDVRLKQGSTTIRTESIALTNTSFADFSFTLTNSERLAITDWTALRVELHAYKNETVPSAQVQVSQVYLKVPEPRRGAISYAALLAPSASRVQISWGEMEIPDASVSYRGDVPTILAGVKTALYLVETRGWTDISKAAYASGVLPAGWNFCSIGNQVIATNRVDPVQLRLNNTGNFVDCITSAGFQPKARFVAPFRQTLLLGDINLTGHDPDEIWWSRQNDVRNFDVTTNEAGYLPIRSRKGQITGLVGGDFATIFKRSSIHGLDWVGGLTLVRVRDVSGSVGTPFGRSIVEAEGLIYFWDGASFRRTDGYSAPERIGSEILSRYLTDASFSEEALANAQPTTLGEEDELITGWYDSSLGLIFWVYAAVDDSPLIGRSRHRRGVIYNPSSDRWATFLCDTQCLNVGVGYPSVVTEDSFMARGSALFTHDGTNIAWTKFSGAETQEVLFQTKRQGIAFDETDRPMSVRITEVMPIFTSKPDDADPPEVVITIRSAEDVFFRRNVREETYGRSKASEAGWYPHNVDGIWFEFEVTVPPTTGTVVAFKGLYVRWETRGRA